MTAAEFATLVDARALGQKRYQARCPAHHDRSPSLSIAEGQDGRILVRCWAGCELDAILASLKLLRRDLFQGPPPSPRQLAAIAAQRNSEEQRRRAARALDRAAWDKVRRLEAVVDALGAKLARTQDDVLEGDALTRVFHDACERLRDAESAALNLSGWKAAA